MNLSDGMVNLGVAALQQQYVHKRLRPSACIEQVLHRIEHCGYPEIWIARVQEDRLMEQARKLDAMLQHEGEAVLKRLPLFGIPFAVKDNIDVAGMPTTAACPDFAYPAKASATVVEKLQAAGALLIGKTNLDQFATGLVGTRSPYGVVRNALHEEYVSGGSSSGSAVAVALDLVSFTLGTDTAGSGRVPAGLNGIVGLKPSRGLLSTRGVFPACRTLDCVSIFAKTISDAWTVTGVAAGYDPADSYSRKIAMQGPKTRHLRIAVPAQPEFYGDEYAQKAFEATLEKLHALPACEVKAIDFTPFQQAAQLLYQGPWVAERLAAVGDFFHEHQGAMHPVVASIIGQGNHYTAVDAFNGQYQLADLRRQAEVALQEVDFLLVPTTPTMPTAEAVLAEPVKRNSELGYYTNFVNFFDMSALAIPTDSREDGLPAGVTLIGPCGADHLLAAAALALQPHINASGVAGETEGQTLPPLPHSEATVQIAVVGAHLEGQPLNWQLRERGARKVATTETAPSYKLYALPGTLPPKPGLVRVEEGGRGIEIEIWEMPARYFGEFVAEVPAPLGIGSLQTCDGQWVKGFVCEPYAIARATDITRYGGWRAFIND